MSTDNHTAIASGAAAAAATINTPLGTLDAAIGNLTTLGTTPKTSVVGALGTAAPTTTAKTVIGAINELDGQIGTAASASGSIGTSVDTDGTLKAGAVDVAAVLADGVVTAAKLLSGAVPSPNLAFDPFNRYYAPTTAAQDGRVRWYTSSTWLTQVSPDANNPFGTPTIRVAATNSAGRKYWLTEMGLKVGDVASFGILCKIPTGKSARISLAWRNAAGGSLGTGTGTTTAGDDTTRWLTLAAQTVPAACVSVDVFILHTSGTGEVDCYYWYAARGALAFLDVTGQESDGQRAMAWLQTARGSAATLDARLDVSLNEDGSLKTSSAIASMLNLAFDPFNRYYAPSSSAQDGRARWYTDANLAQVSPDASNPYGLPTIRATSSGGRRLYLDEAGLMPGDVVSVGILALVPATRVFSMACAFYDAGGSLLDTSADGMYTGTDAALAFSYNNLTIPATATRVDVFPFFRSGTGDIDIYAWYLTRAAALNTGSVAESVLDGQRALAWLQAARGSLATLDARLDVSLNEDGSLRGAVAFPATNLAYGAQYLRDWQAQLAKIRLADGTSQAVVAVLGDSWTNGDVRLTKPLRTLLQAEFGDAGIGWLSATVDGTYASPVGITRTQAGTWTNRSLSTTPVGRGVDLGEALTLDETAPVGSLAVTATFTDAVIHYLAQVDGGSFRWRIDAGGWTTVDTAAAATALAVANINGLSNASHTLTIEVVTAGTAGVILYGVDCQIAGNGVRVHKLGASGARTSHWATLLDATVWSDSLTALAPNLCVICLGTNDDSADVAPATYLTNLETIITRIRAALPLADVLLLAPSDNGLVAGTYAMADYVTQLRTCAADNDTAMFDSYLLLGDYTDANTRGLYGDTAHISETGGRVIIGRLCRELLLLD